MTLDEAIQHAREVAQSGCSECCKEHEQLAEWLEELRDRRQVSAKKAYWEPSEDGEYHCTNCGVECDIDQFHKALLNPYCGNCGAKMW